MNYELIAELGDTGTSRYTFTAPDDNTAIMDGSFTVMDRAMNSVIWARGYIRLINKDTGEILKTMDAKPNRVNIDA